MSEPLYSNLQGAIRQSADGQRYEFGFLVNGGFVSFSAAQAAAFEDDLREAQEAAQQQQQTQTPATQ